jgi:enamine deaminase RidA (YjgF/YER057c/UK114 family)
MRHYLNQREIRRDYFREPFQAWTVVAVNPLAHEDWIIEISAQAYVESS